MKIIKKSIMTVFVVVMVVILFFVYSNTHISIHRYLIQDEKISSEFDGYRIAVITDLHSAEFGKNNKKLCKKLENQHPDAVLMAGDMINSTDEEFGVFYNFAKTVAAEYETYYIFGNHELILSDKLREEIVNKVSALGIKVLDNEKVTLKKNGESINLYGMWFNLRYYRDATDITDDEYNFTKMQMQKILGDADTKEYNILLTHNPVYFDAYADWHADLVISGHMHGGMVRIPFKGGVFSPEKDRFPKYDIGLFENKNCRMIVSGGLGNGISGFRFNNCPDLTIIDLEKGI
ncbi:MAG: metallophosphoesterase [Oscillospiraceae bacterium]